jgi:hypothetical protein
MEMIVIIMTTTLMKKTLLLLVTATFAVFPVMRFYCVPTKIVLVKMEFVHAVDHMIPIPTMRSAFVVLLYVKTVKCTKLRKLAAFANTAINICVDIVAATFVRNVRGRRVWSARLFAVHVYNWECDVAHLHNVRDAEALSVSRVWDKICHVSV